MSRPIRDARQFSIDFIRNRSVFMYILYGLSEPFFSLIRYTWLRYFWLNKPIISPQRLLTLLLHLRGHELRCLMKCHNKLTCLAKPRDRKPQALRLIYHESDPAPAPLHIARNVPEQAGKHWVTQF